MLTEPLIQQLISCACPAWPPPRAAASLPDLSDRSFEDRLGIMIQHEFVERASHRLTMRLRWAKLPVSACLEDIDTRSPEDWSLDNSLRSRLELDPRTFERPHHRTNRRR